MSRLSLSDAVVLLGELSGTASWHSDGRCYVEARDGWTTRQANARSEDGSPTESLVLAVEKLVEEKS